MGPVAVAAAQRRCVVGGLQFIACDMMLCGVAWPVRHWWCEQRAAPTTSRASGWITFPHMLLQCWVRAAAGVCHPLMWTVVVDGQHGAAAGVGACSSCALWFLGPGRLLACAINVQT
jgi:hypothetical protein